MVLRDETCEYEFNAEQNPHFTFQDQTQKSSRKCPYY